MKLIASLLLAAVLLVGVAPFGVAEAQQMTGVNMAGAEFGKVVPGKVNTDYIYPKPEDFDYFISRGLRTFRLPFNWSRLQADGTGPYDAAQLALIDKAVADATSQGAKIILDPHNYGGLRFTDGSIHAIGTARLPTANFVALWVMFANRYKGNPNVIFGLMNEPKEQSPAAWKAIVDAVMPAIRATGATNLILVPHASWDGCHTFVNKSGALFEGFNDPNFAFECHVYFDSDNSGSPTAEACTDELIGVKRTASIMSWAKARGHKLWLGEFGSNGTPACQRTLKNLVDVLKDPVWAGWSYWSAGRWWGGYGYSIHPRTSDSQSVQDSKLQRIAILTGGVAPAPSPDPVPGDNVAPLPTFTWTVTDLSVKFQGSATDSDGTVVSYSWDFGDGHTVSGTRAPRHTFVAGTYNVTFTAVDDDGASGSIIKQITVGVAPIPDPTPDPTPVPSTDCTLTLTHSTGSVMVTFPCIER